MGPIRNEDQDSRLMDANLSGVETIRDAAERLRHGLIDVAFHGVMTAANIQLELLHKLNDPNVPVGTQIPCTVTEGVNKFIPTPPNSNASEMFSIFLAPNEKLGQKRRGQEALWVYVPVPETVHLDPDEEIHVDELERPDSIVVERVNPLGEVKSYLISRDNVKVFQNVILDGTPVSEEEFDMHNFTDLVGHRVDPKDAVMMQLLVELTDWSTQVQYWETKKPDTGEDSLQ